MHASGAMAGHGQRPGNQPVPQPNPDGENTVSLLSIVVPAYNEEENLAEFESRTRTICEQLEVAYEIVFVNDGSSDGTLPVIRELQQKNANITIVNLSRNFGKEIALAAGLDNTTGDAVAILDADLQDPPELLVDLLAKWKEGYDVVYAQREARDGETWFKKKSAEGFYKVMQWIGPVRIPSNTGDCRLMSRKVVDELGRLREHHRFMKGLFAWVGFNAAAVTYRRAPRYAGKSKWNYWKLWNLSLEAITSFTTLPLRITFYVGALIAGFAFLFGLIILARTLIFGDPVRGFPALAVTVLFLGGGQLFALGLIGEYLGRVFNETKGRPLYVVDRIERAKRQRTNAPVAKRSAA